LNALQPLIKKWIFKEIEMDDRAKEILAAVLNAMQPAEELGGPIDGAYIELMNAIAAEASKRAAAAAGD
jgi:hypothetical protein